MPENVALGIEMFQESRATPADKATTDSRVHSRKGRGKSLMTFQFSGKINAKGMHSYLTR